MNEFLANIIHAINSVVHSYGVSIILFTLLIRLLLYPLNLKGRVGMRKMADIGPKVQALHKKYANDKDKLNAKTQELYRKEGVNPLSGCLPMLLSFPILIIMFNAMRQVANIQLLNQVYSFLIGKEANFEGFLWIKNLWMPDSPFYPTAPTISMLKLVGLNDWQSAFNALSQADQQALMAAVPNLSFDNLQNLTETISAALANNAQYMSHIQTLPGWENINLFISRLSVFKNYNGLLILPILAAATQFVATKFMPQQPQQEGAPNTSFMTWFFPIFSAYICLNYNASFALYWVAANVFSTVETIFMNKYLDKKTSNEVQSVDGGALK